MQNLTTMAYDCQTSQKFHPKFKMADGFAPKQTQPTMRCWELKVLVSSHLSYFLRATMCQCVIPANL